MCCLGARVQSSYRGVCVCACVDAYVSRAAVTAYVM